MNKLTLLTLKVLRKLYKIVFPRNKSTDCIKDADVASDLIVKHLLSKEPCMIARFGAFEMSTIINYLGVKKEKINFLEYIKGNEPDPLWNPSLIKQMNNNAGFFPPEIKKIEQFCELMLVDLQQVDILGSWLTEEDYFKHQIPQNSKINLLLLDPYWSKIPWTKTLKDKKILVVHPFKNTIEKQYLKRTLLFKNNDILPEFKSLKVIRAVQSIAGSQTEFENWFEALEHMKQEIDNSDYDICLIAAGAYGFPLAAHVKRQGKKAIHFGGSLQLLFGIKGARWEDPHYNESFAYYKLINEHWVKPSEDETPANIKNVENGCYW